MKTESLSTPKVDQDNISAQAIQGAKWSLLDKWGSRIFSLVIFGILGHLVAPHAFGLLALSITVIALFTLLVDNGTSEAIIRRTDFDRDFIDTAFWISIAAGMVLFGVCFVSADFVATLYGEAELAPVIRVLAAGLILQSLIATQEAILQREFRFQVIALRRLVATIAGGITGIVWAFVSPDVWALAAQYLVAAAVSVIVLWASSTYRPRLKIKRSFIKEIVTFGTSLIGIRLLTFVTEQGDNFFVGLLLGPTQLGYYAIGYKLFSMITELTTSALSAVALPTFSRMQNNPEQMNRAILYATRISVIISAPLAAVLAASAPWMVPLIFGDQWGPSIPVMQILSLVALWQCCVFFDRSVLIAAGRVNLELGISLLAALRNVAVFWVGAHFGITWVAAGLAVAVYLFWPIRLFALKSTTGISLRRYLGQWLRPVVCSLTAMAVMSLIWRALESLYVAPVQLITGIAVYLGCMYLLDRKAIQEIVNLALETLGQMIPKRKRALQQP